jgi:hypothetical protein
MSLACAAPEELSSIANVMPCPPMPFVDEKWHGKLVIFGLMCWAGDAEAGQKALQPYRDLAKLGGLDAPIADMLEPMSYAGMYPPEDPGYRPMAVALNMFIDQVDRKTAETIMDRLEKVETPMRAVQLRVLGGASARVPNDATAYGHRDSEIMVNIAAFYDGSEADRERKLEWATELMGAMHQTDEGV